MRARHAALAMGILLITHTPAFAQGANTKLFINVSGGLQGGTQDSTVTLTPTIYGEVGAVAATRVLDKKNFFDVTLGRPLTERFGVAASFSVRTSTADGAAAASIPDPIFFNRPRTVTAPIPDMVHEERWFAILGTMPMVVSEKIDALVMFGPAVVSVKHDSMTAATATEATGGPRVSVTVEPQSQSLVGFQAGIDLRYAFTGRIGAGILLSYTRASGSIVPGTKMNLGGPRGGIGLRITF
jgi:hypothetical protein